MDNLDQSGELTPIVIDLHAAKRGKVEESFLRMFGGAIQSILGRMFGGAQVPVQVRGTKKEIGSFAKAVEGERRYMRAYQRYGLDDPRTYKNRHKLENAVKNFERTTGLLWPFR